LSETVESRAARWIPEAVFLAATTAAGIAAGGRWLDPVGDPGFSWSLAYRLARGERLYRDIYFAYGPLSPHLLALWARLFGVSSNSILLLNWIPAVAAGLLLLLVTRRLLTPFERIALAGMVLATSLFVPGAGRLVLPYYAGVVHAFVFSVAALLLVARPRLLRGGAPLAAGALAGLAFCCKQEIGVAAFAALLIAVFAGVERPLRWALGVTAGFGAVALAAAVFVALAAPLPVLRDRDHLWPLNPRPPAAFDALFRSVSGLSEPDWFGGIRRSAWRVLAGIGLFAVLGGLLARERSRRAWSRILWLAAALSVWWGIERFPLAAPSSAVRLSVIASCAVTLCALASPAFEGRALAAAIGVFAALTGMRAVFSPYVSGPYEGPAHFAAAASWALLLLVFVPRALWPAADSSRARRITRSGLAAVLAVVFWWTAVGDAASLRFPWKETVQTPKGPIYVERGQAALYREIARRVRPGESVLVFPEINAVDALFGLRSASPLLHHFPGWLDRELESELIARFEKDPPSKIVVFERPTTEFGVDSFGRGYATAIREWSLRHYRVAWSSPRGAILERAAEGARP